MNIEDLISQYIDGSLPSEAEAELHHRLAVSPEARRLFRAHIMLKGVARDQRVLQVPSAESRAKLFERLGREEGMKLPGSQPPAGYDPVASPDAGTNPATGTAADPSAPTGPTPRSIASPAVRGNASRRRRRVLPWLIPVVMAGLMIGILWNVGDDARRGSGDIAGTKVEDVPPGRTGDLSNPSAPTSGTFSDAGPSPSSQSTPNAAGTESRTGNQAAGRASGSANEVADTVAGGSGMASGKGSGAVGSAAGSNVALRSAPSDDVNDHVAANSSPRRLEYSVPPEQRSAPRIASSRKFRSRDDGSAQRSASRNADGLYENEISPRLNRTGAHQEGLALNGSGAAKAPSVDLETQSRADFADNADAKQQSERRTLGGKEEQPIKEDLGSKLGGGYAMSVPPAQMRSQDSTSYRIDGRIAASDPEESSQSKSAESDNNDRETSLRVEHLAQSNSSPKKDLAFSIQEGGDQSRKVAKKSVTAEESVPQADSKQADPPVLSSNAAQVTTNDGASSSMPSDGIAAAAPPPPPAPEERPVADSTRTLGMRSTSRVGDEDNPLSPYAPRERVQYVAGLAQRSMVNLRASSFTIQLVARGGVELPGGHQLYLLVGGTSYRRIGFDTVVAAASGGVPVTPNGPVLASDTASRFDEVFGGVGYRYTALVVIRRMNIGLGGWTGAGKRYFRAGAEIPVTFELSRAIKIELVPTLEYARPFSGAATSTATEIDPSLPYSEQRHRTESPEGSGDLSVGIGIGASVRW